MRARMLLKVLLRRCACRRARPLWTSQYRLAAGSPSLHLSGLCVCVCVCERERESFFRNNVCVYSHDIQHTHIHTNMHTHSHTYHASIFRCICRYGTHAHIGVEKKTHIGIERPNACRYGTHTHIGVEKKNTYRYITPKCM